MKSGPFITNMSNKPLNWEHTAGIDVVFLFFYFFIPFWYFDIIPTKANEPTNIELNFHRKGQHSFDMNAQLHRRGRKKIDHESRTQRLKYLPAYPRILSG